MYIEHLDNMKTNLGKINSKELILVYLLILFLVFFTNFNTSLILYFNLVYYLYKI